MHAYRFAHDSWNAVALTHEDTRPAPAQLRIVTYNVYLKGGTIFDVDPCLQLLFDKRMNGVIDLLAQQDADVVCLQEVTGRALAIFLQCTYIRDNYYTTDCSGKTLGRYGVLILSKYLLRNTELCRIPTRMGRNLLRTNVCFSSGTYATVATVHLDSMRHSAEQRQEQLRSIEKLLSEGNGSDCSNRNSNCLFTVLCGDFNLTDKEDVSPLTSHGWTDCWLEIKGQTEDTGATIGVNYRSDTHPPARFDRFYWRPCALPLVYVEKATHRFGDQVIKMDGLQGYASDHIGVVLDMVKISSHHGAKMDEEGKDANALLRVINDKIDSEGCPTLDFLFTQLIKPTHADKRIEITVDVVHDYETRQLPAVVNIDSSGAFTVQCDALTSGPIGELGTMVVELYEKFDEIIEWPVLDCVSYHGTRLGTIFRRSVKCWATEVITELKAIDGIVECWYDDTVGNVKVVAMLRSGTVLPSHLSWVEKDMDPYAEYE